QQPNQDRNVHHGHYSLVGDHLPYYSASSLSLSVRLLCPVSDPGTGVQVQAAATDDRSLAVSLLGGQLYLRPLLSLTDNQRPLFADIPSRFRSGVFWKHLQSFW